MLAGLFGQLLGSDSFHALLLQLDIGDDQRFRQRARFRPLPQDGHEGKEAHHHQGADQPGRDRIPPAPPCQPAQEPHRARPDRLVVQEPAQVVGQPSGRRVPLAGLLLQALQADRLQVARRARLELTGPNRGAADDLQEGRHPIRAQERGPAGQHFVKDHPQRVDVRRRRDRCRRRFSCPIRDLLRRHVRRRAR